MRTSVWRIGTACALAAMAAAAGCAADARDDDVDAGDGSGDDDVDPEPTARAFVLRVENIATAYPFVKSGRFDTALGGTTPGPIGPGEQYEVRFTAGRGSRLSFVTMFGESNDYFFAPDGAGIALYDSYGKAVMGDVTSQVRLWDAGTELDEEPGRGASQAPRQPTPDHGAPDPDPRVRRAENLFGNLPAVPDVIRAELIAQDGGRFILRIRNVSTATTLRTSAGEAKPVPLTPGVFVVHAAPDPLFTANAPDRGDGLEQIAEAGMPQRLGGAVAKLTGVTARLGSGVWVLHRDAAPLFTPGAPDAGAGLEALAEDGLPGELAASLATAVGPDRSGRLGPGDDPATWLAPGQAFEVTFAAAPGDRLSFAMMFTESNDRFYAPGPEGIALFDGDRAVDVDVTGALALWDAGTEWNQEPGVGNDQAPRQPAPGYGPRTEDPIDAGDDGMLYPETRAVLRATIAGVPEA